jgi:molybdenum cofactor biosynthesis protein B
MPKLDDKRPFIPVRIAVLTVSDTRSVAEDTSGNALVDMLESAMRAADRRPTVGRPFVLRSSPGSGPQDRRRHHHGALPATGRVTRPQPLFEKEIEGFSTSSMIIREGHDLDDPEPRAAGSCRIIFCLPNCRAPAGRRHGIKVA